MTDKVTVGIIHKVLTIAANQLLTFDALFSQTLSTVCLMALDVKQGCL